MSKSESILEDHVFMEAVGGYIECGCGWPTRQQYLDGEHESVHVIVALRAAGVLDEVGAT